MKTTVIDAHAHLGINPRFYFPFWRCEDVLEHMDWCKVDYIIQPHQSMMNGDWECGLAETLQAYEKSDGRILAYAPFNPNTKNLEKVDELLGQMPFVGIKIHPSSHGLSADEEEWRDCWLLAQKHQTPILTHSYDRNAASPSQRLSWVRLFEKWLQEFPDVSLILGHSGGLPRGNIEAVQMARKYPNIYLDIAGDNVSPGFIEWTVNELGAERLLYASDLTWIDSRVQLWRVITAEVSDAEKNLILGKNAIRLFELSQHTAES